MVSPADWRPPQIVLAALQSLSFPTSSLPFSPRVVLLHPRLCSGASVKDVSEQCVKDVMKLNTFRPAPPRRRIQQGEKWFSVPGRWAQRCGQVLFKPVDRAHEGVDLVFPLGEAMAFLR